MKPQQPPTIDLLAIFQDRASKNADARDKQLSQQRRSISQKIRRMIERLKKSTGG